MFVRINQDRCAGCGICVDECPTGAIHLENGWAVIDQARCTNCQTCAEVCPNEAVEVVYQQPTSAVVPVQEIESQVMPIQERISSPVPVQAKVIQHAPVKSSRSIAPIASAALAYMGREVFPRVIDAMVTALENRVTRSAEHNHIPIEPARSTQQNILPRGRGKQIRYHGGRGKGRNRIGRR